MQILKACCNKFFTSGEREIITEKSAIYGGGGDLIRRFLKSRKFHNNKVTYEDQTYDSMHEYQRYLELIALQKEGMISDLQRQVKYLLIPAQREPETIGKRGGIIKGKLIEREVAYYADFVYKDEETGKIVVEDAKGVCTKEYILKRKMMLYFHHIRIKEV